MAGVNPQVAAELSENEIEVICSLFNDKETITEWAVENRLMEHPAVIRRLNEIINNEVSIYLY